MTKETMKALIAEARKRQPLIDRLLARVGYVDGWFCLKGEIVRRQPFRWFWTRRAALLLYHRWNRPVGHRDHHSRRNCWEYALALAEMLDEAGEGYLSPSEAIDIDREYWED